MGWVIGAARGQETPVLDGFFVRFGLRPAREPSAEWNRDMPGKIFP